MKINEGHLSVFLKKNLYQEKINDAKKIVTILKWIVSKKKKYLYMKIKDITL